MKFIKIIYYIKSLFKKKDLNYLEEQTKIFSKNNLNYQEGKNKLENILKNLDLKKYEMNSEHLKIFSAISLKKKVQNILEIGTYDGSNCLFLNKLFPLAKIDTIDLAAGSNEYKNLYDRDNEIKNNEINKTRLNNLTKSNKINFCEKNSLKLILENEKKYDLIWIDGFHGAPTVIVDIVNSLRLINLDGIILIDDVFFHGETYSAYQSDAALKTITCLKKANLINYSLFYKRLDKKNNLNEFDQKFIALIKKC
jgi:predicted O-methyltransferase YrrM